MVRRPLTAPERLREIRAALIAIEDLCPGSLVERRTLCGKPTCRCARDPAARHGPYYIWSRRERRRLVQTLLAPAQARRMRRAIASERRARRLLAAWGRETARAILSSNARST